MTRIATTRRGFLKAAAGAAAAPILRGQGFPVAGGSNLVCWRFDDGPHGYAKEFSIAQAAIIGQLRQMYTAGQRRISVMVPYFEIGNTFALDSSSGALTTADRASFTGLLSAIRDTGFQHVMIRMQPEWSAFEGNWLNSSVMATYGVGTWRPRSFDRDYCFTSDVWETTIKIFPDPYSRGIDLCAEGVPPAAAYTTNWNGTIKWLQRFWSDWCADYGAIGTVGYSFVPTQDRVANLALVHPDILPAIWAPTAYSRSLSEWTAFKGWIDAAGLTRGYIPIETYSDDPEVAAIFNSDSNIFWWYAWPVGTDTASGVQQDRLSLTYLGPR